MEISVYFSPENYDNDTVQHEIAVVIDIFRATASIVTAFN